MSHIRGVLLAGGFRSHHELNQMSLEDQRNTLIVELSNRCKSDNYQKYDTPTLVGIGAVFVFLRKARIRDDAGLRTMSADDQRNTLIVEIDGQVHRGRALQGLSNLELVLIGLGRYDSYIRGILLAGGFRSHHELLTMSTEDQRNTLIVELAGRSNQHDYQRYDNATLAGMGAILLFLREGRIRTDAQIRTITSDEQRNIAIVEIDGQVHMGSQLQGLSNLDLVRVALGGLPTDSIQHILGSSLDGLKPAPPENSNSGEFSREGAVWYISLDNNDTVTLCRTLQAAGGTGGGTIASAVLAGGAGVFGAAWPTIVAALATGAEYILTINAIGGNNGVDINGVVGTMGIIVTPRVGKFYGKLIQAARVAVTGRTIIEFILLASSKIPALASSLDIPVAASVFNAVMSGTPLGWAIAGGLGFLVKLFESPPDPDEHGGIHADRDQIGSWESFIMANTGPGNTVSILSWQGLFSARGGGGSNVYANRPEVKEWETWTLIRNSDGTISLRTFNGHYLCAEMGGGRECKADRTSIGNWEKFWVVNLPDGKIALKTFEHGKYVSVQKDV